MSSCSSFYIDFLNELSKESVRDLLALAATLSLVFLSFLYIVYRMNTSNRKLLILIQDVMRNIAVSIVILLLSPAFLSLICYSFTSISPISADQNNDFDALIQFGDQQMFFLENLIIATIRNYRDRAISEFGPSTIVYSSFSSFGKGTVYLPSKEVPRASLFLDRANDAIGALNGILVSIALQRFILNLLVSIDLFYIILIMALLIRIIPGLREAGDFMYSLTIAVFIVLPLLYTLFTYPILIYVSPASLCSDIRGFLPEGFSFKFLTPLSCYDVSFIEIFTVYAIFIPNLVYGLTFSFASSFKKIFDVFNIGG